MYIAWRTYMLMLALLSCVRWPAPEDVGSPAEVRRRPQRAQSRAALQTGSHSAAAAGPRKNRYNPSLIACNLCRILGQTKPNLGINT